MLARLRRILQGTGGQAQSSKRAVLPKLSGAELARSSWAKRIESWSELPEAYKNFFPPLLATGRPFPYIVLTPSHERFIHRASEKLICLFENEIDVVARNGDRLETQCYPLDGISYVEFKTALLASSFKICGANSHGVYASSALIFNSVTDYLFTPILKRVRGRQTDLKKAAGNSKQEQFSHLARVNYKFMNFARHSMLGDEKFALSVFQPEIRERFLAFLGKAYYRTISPTHMLILTDRELILIREEAVRRREDRYGGIWEYLPLRKIVSLSFSEKNDDLRVLCIQLPGNTCFELLFQNSTREDVDELMRWFRELTLDTN